MKSTASAPLAFAFSANATQIDIPGPPGSTGFGTIVAILPNGNIVVSDPYADTPAPDAGAVYLYSPTRVLISTLTGSSADDHVGGVTVLTGGNFVVYTSEWDNGTTTDVGAVTWVSGSAGLSGTVSGSNSLIGSSASDQIGSQGVTALTNGNYVVGSALWDTGIAADVGAVTWGDGAVGRVGSVSAANSLIGSTTGDQVGSYRVVALSNGNYVVCSPRWDAGSIADAGAVTFGNGTAGTVAAVSAANSLVGTTANDRIGSDDNGTTGAIALTTGNYVVRSPNWDNGTAANAGAVTLGNGSSGLSGAITPGNSLVGSTAADRIGSDYIWQLANGNYVVVSALWDNGAIADVGAATWGNGMTGVSGAVSPANSLIGTTAGDRIGAFGIAILSDGDYVVGSAYWSNAGIANAGAATWADGDIGLSGQVSASNSLVGSSANDFVAGGVTALTNGNYVVVSNSWSNGAIANVGAVTWASAGAPFSGVVSSTNSLTGTVQDDYVGEFGVTALSNGNYVVSSGDWNNGASVRVGAATWVNGSVGLVGTVTPANSLIGLTPFDWVCCVTALSNGNYVVRSMGWSNGANTNLGAVTWANGATGIVGTISAANSLVGTTTNDRIGDGGLDALSNGDYLVFSPGVGALSLGRGSGGLVGAINPGNSLIGGVPSSIGSTSVAYDVTRSRLAVGRPARNVVTLLTPPSDALFADDFE